MLVSISSAFLALPPLSSLFVIYVLCRPTNIIYNWTVHTGYGKNKNCTAISIRNTCYQDVWFRSLLCHDHCRNRMNKIMKRQLFRHANFNTKFSICARMTKRGCHMDNNQAPAQITQKKTKLLPMCYSFAAPIRARCDFNVASLGPQGAGDKLLSVYQQGNLRPRYFFCRG